MEKAISFLLSAFIMLAVGLALIGVYADLSNQQTSLTTYSATTDISVARLAGGTINTTYHFPVQKLVDANSGWRNSSSTCSAGVIVYGLTVTNSSGSAYVDPTDVVRVTNGYYTLQNTAKVNNSASNTTLVSLPYCPDGYIDQPWSRSILGITVGLLAVLLLLGTIGFFYAAYKEWGLDK